MAYTIELHADTIIRDVDEAADEATALTGLAIENDTKRETPVRGAYRSLAPAIAGKRGHQIGGTLRRSYTTAAPGTEGSPTGGGDAFANVRAGALLVGSWLGYAYFVDRGTVKMPPRPHFTPAIGRNLPLWIARFGRAYEKRAR